jgi:TnpA family transposase
MNGLARNRINRELITRNWDDMLRVAGSLRMGTLGPVELMRSLQGGSRASRLGQALAELGRIPNTVIC